ncbi:MAG: GDP-mannose 4,6-dehydratase [Thermoplasmata archaeon]
MGEMCPTSYKSIPGIVGQIVLNTVPLCKSMSKIAFITGITGQDGSYFAEFLRQRDMRCTGSCADSQFPTQRTLTISLTRLHCWMGI